MEDKTKAAIIEEINNKLQIQRDVVLRSHHQPD
jgi:hypothetical protein